MKKPDRVEVGQWWLFGTRDLFRLAHTLDIGLLTDENAKYLGSGEHPEPSEWMIETLVDAMSEIENGGPAVDEPSRGRFDRTNYSTIVRDAIDGKSHDLTYTRCVGVIYRLLRSLGKW